MKIDDALAGLVRGLREAEGARDSRQSVAVALHAVWLFLKGIPEVEQQSLEAPIFSLLLALQDLTHGTVAPMLRTVASPNRHPDSTARRIMKAYCSFAVDLLLDAGFCHREACEMVAKSLSGDPILRGQSEGNWKKVKGWRDGVAKLDLSNQERLVLEELRTSERGVIGAMPKEAARDHVKAMLLKLRLSLGRYGSE